MEFLKKLFGARKPQIEDKKVPVSSQSRELTPEEQQSIEALVADLHSKDKDVRDAAVGKLEQMDAVILGAASQLFVEPLVVAARWGHNYNDDASRTAVRVLVKTGKSAVQPLLKLMEDDNYRSVHLACIALAKMGDSTYAPDARAKLGSYVKQVHDEWKARHTITGMVEIGDEYVVDFLMLDVLKTHPNESVRASAAMALGQIGDKRAIPALRKALQDPSWQNVRPAAKWALNKLE